MSIRTRESLLRRIYDNFMRTTFGVGKRIVVGKDHIGNVYYVFEGDTRKATNRGYIPSDTRNWEEIPVEWEAWLRGRRRDTPTQEEIDQNSERTGLARARGMELEQQREIERQQESEKEQREFLESRGKVGLDSQQPHDSTLRNTPLPEIKSSNVEGIPGDQTKQYPVHKEYEQYPGEEPKKK